MTEKNTVQIPLSQKQIYLVHNYLLYRIQIPLTFIGRHPTNNIILNAPTVSRFHARLKYEDGWFSLYDFGSKYGTFVNGTQIKMQRLQSGDKIRLAKVEITFLEDSKEIARLTNRKTGQLVMVTPNSQHILQLETHS